MEDSVRLPVTGRVARKLSAAGNDDGAQLRQRRLDRAGRHRRAAARCVPLLEGNGGKGGDRGGIEMCSAAAEDLRPRRLRAPRIAKGARVGDRLVRLGEMEDPGAWMDLLGAETEGIALPVPALVVRDDDLARLLEIGNAGQHPVPE